MRIIVCVILFFALGFSAFAQVQTVDEIITPTPQFQDHGGITPWFWIGVQTVFGAGYNLETTAGGFRNYGGDNHTYASFNLAFVDSHYQTPKFYQVPRELDPHAWTGHFVLLNFTSRLNSWNAGNTVVMENNAPAWLAEITGKGFRIGFFTQAGMLIGGVDDPNRTEQSSSNPITRITGGNMVINLQENQLGTLFYERSNDPFTSTTYSTSSASEGGLLYVGYDMKDVFSTYLTMLSQGNVNSDVTNDANRGFAGVIDFNVTPFGLYADDQKPFVLDISGNFIAGFNWKGMPASFNESMGFGLRTTAEIWIKDNFTLAPVLAFDGKLNANNEFRAKFGAGLTFRFSGMRWLSDEWGDLFRVDRNAGNFANHRYENNKILKFAHAQFYMATAPKSNGETDLNMFFRVEEPDGNAGFHDKLGFMAELRLYNMAEKQNSFSWAAQGRVSYDFNVKHYLITPYLRAYLDSNAVFKLRIGAYANFIPYTGFEIAYTSANLNRGATGPINNHMTTNPSYRSNFDAGRLELMVILKSDDIRPQMPKRMSDWNYPSAIQDF
ncbi:MAG: hypothetical protein FWD26_04845 [Treponema sp.]|nr:hypothetical protein [Treponema sp.]